MDGKIIVLVGPSACGKTLIQKRLVDKYKRVITATTRKPREDEVDGLNYYFYSEEEFLKLKSEGQFLENSEYVGNLYGTPKFSLEKAINNGETRTIILDMQGALNIKKSFPKNTTIIFIGSNIQSLLRRLINERNSSAEEIESRIKKAEDEELKEEYWGQADHVVWNNDEDDIEFVLQKVLNFI